MDRDEMSNLYRGPSIDASYQVSVHLAEGFQWRRLKCEKLTDDGRRMPSDSKSSHWPLARRAKNVLGLLYTRKTDGFVFLNISYIFVKSPGLIKAKHKSGILLL
jgi:hypothetical protein